MKLPHFIVNWLFRKMLRLAYERKPDFLIGGDVNPYMYRWWVIPRNKIFNIYLHEMLRDDDDVLHDHPWASMSIILAAPMLFEKFKNGEYIARRPISTGQVIFRRASFAHQMIVPRPAWTLFITGPVVRSWGFHCPKGWRLWNDYVEKTEGASVKGRGCGEMS